MRSADDWYLEREWPDSVNAKHARAKLVLYLCDRFAELVEWAALKCEAGGEPLTEPQKAAFRSAGAMLLRAEGLPDQPRRH
ncbi:MAG: hypothetical protein H0V07_13165 [Propionibacteriales bacterium]|nr:hypothetical protein [Propionibacteriales bacterium]